MSLLYHWTPETLKEHGFTHTALAFGFVPVYVGNLPNNLQDGELVAEISIATRNWIPEFLFDWAEEAFFFFASMTADDEDLVQLPLKITGELNG